MLYCVIDSYGDIIGRFKTYERAIDYFLDCWFDGMDKVKIKKMTGKEYQEYMKKLFDNPKEECDEWYYYNEEEEEEEE